MKKPIVLLLIFFIFFSGSLEAQYNPYLDKKKKNKPSATMARQNKKDLKRQKRMAKKQMHHSKKHLNRKR